MSLAGGVQAGEYGAIPTDQGNSVNAETGQDEEGADNTLGTRHSRCCFKTSRKKKIATAMVYFDYFAFSWLYSVIGPSLPDLQDIVDVDLQAASWIFTTFSLGYMIGCGLHGFLYGRLDSGLLLALYALLSGLFWTATPWCTYYWLMLLVRFLGGIAWGCTDSGVHSQLFAIWGVDAGPFSVALYLIDGLGGTASTFAISPFLEDQVDQPDVVKAEVSTSTTTVTGANTQTQAMLLMSTHANETHDPTANLVLSMTKMQCAYLIAGSISVLASLPLFVNYIAAKCCVDKRHEALGEQDTTEHNVTKRSRGVFLTAMVLLSVIILIMTGLIDTYSGFLVTFTLHQLKWSKKEGALLTSVFYISVAAGNLVCIFLTLVVHSRTLLILSMIGTILSFVGLTASAIFLIHPGIWVFDVTTGLFLSPLWPVFFTFVEENITPVAGTVAAIFLFMGAGGMSINPLIVGYTMSNLSPIYFTYIALAESLLICLLFTTVVCMYRRGSNSYKEI